MTAICNVRVTVRWEWHAAELEGGDSPHEGPHLTLPNVDKAEGAIAKKDDCRSLLNVHRNSRRMLNVEN